MKNRKIGLIAIVLIFIIFLTFIIIHKKDFDKSVKSTNSIDTNINNKEKEDNMDSITNIKIIINEKEYNAIFENNDTTKAFINKLPQEFNMQDLNENEKYVYMQYSLPTNSKNPKHINKGDIMLYGDNCLVIFYKSFDTNYSYTKIGYIEDIDDLGIDTVTVKIEK